MTLNTTRLVLPYPEPNDTVDVPRDMLALANRLDTIAARQPGAPLAAQPVLDVGLLGQIRAGRQLAPADFTAMGLSAPVGLWNLSDITDASGNARTLTNKGVVPFGVGINGAAATAAQFAGSTAQALYRADTGAADPFRITAGSMGCWFKTAKQTGSNQTLISKFQTTGNQRAYWLFVQPTLISFSVYIDGSIGNSIIVPFVPDDRWHFVVGVYDGTTQRLMLDGVEVAAVVASSPGPMFGSTAPLNIGSWGADASVVSSDPHYGRIDEAFITTDVLSEDQARNLYCAKIAHGYVTTPVRANINVRRRKRGGAWAVADFPTQPVRLHNFTGGSFADEGSGGVALAGSGVVSVAGADGSSAGALSYAGAQWLTATDAGLPAALATRSYGCWFKSASTSPVYQNLMAWGTAGTADVRSRLNAGGLQVLNTGDVITGPFVADGQWHLLTVVEDNAAGDGVKRKAYIDGDLVGGSTVMLSVTLSGGFRTGASSSAIEPLIGQVDGVFVCNYALTGEQVAALYAKGSQALALSSKNAGDHVEAMDATNVLVAFDTLDTTAQVDMGVQA